MRTALPVSRDQRDALLTVCDEIFRRATRARSPADWRATARMPTVTALADDLVLPDAEGGYSIASVTADALASFLEHELMLTLENPLDHRRLRVWHMCVTLLERLGRELDGSIYSWVSCRCADCAWQAECQQRFEARYFAATNEAERQAAFDEYARAAEERYGGTAP